MKTFKICILAALILISGGQILSAQSKKEKNEQKAKDIKEMVEEQRFTIDVDRALPMSGSSINLTSPYSLEMRGDSVISYLPYYGRAYSLPYGGGDGMRFTKTVNDYRCAFNKKGTAEIKFTARTDDDTYRFDIRVYPNGSSSIQVLPTNKQTISYDGEINPKEDKK